MKIQFSLRSLLFSTVCGGLAVGCFVQAFIGTREPSEMITRRREIYWHISNWSKLLMELESRKPNSNCCIDDSDRFANEYQWSICGDLSEVPGTERQQRKQILNVRATCKRSGIEIQPILIEYDDALENEKVVQGIKALCDKNQWICVVRKVEKLIR